MPSKFLTYLQTRFGSTKKGLEFLQFSGWLLCLGITLPVMSSVLISPVVALIVGMLFVLGILGTVLVWKKGLTIVLSPVDAGMISIFFAVLVTTYFSIDPSRGMRMVLQWASLILLFYILLVLFRSGFSFYPLVKALLIITSVFVLFGYFELFVWLFKWYAKRGWLLVLPPPIIRPSGLIDNPNPFGDLLGMVFAMAVIVFIEFKRYTSVRWWFWLLTTAGMLIASQSRGTWVGLLVAFSLYGLSKAWFKSVVRGYFSPKVWGGVFFAIASGIVVFVVLSLMMRPTTFVADSSLSVRWELWRIALKSWIQHPWLGNGPNIYATLQLQADPLFDGSLHRAAHNFYLNTLAEMGVVGIVATLLLFAQIVRTLWKRRQLWSKWTFVFITPLVFFTVHMQLDLAWLRTMVLATIFLAALVATLVPSPDISFRRIPVTFFLVCIWLFVIAGGIISWKNIKQYERGMGEIAHGDWNGAGDAFRIGQSYTPYKNSLFLLASGFSEGVSAYGDDTYLLSAIKNQEQLVLLEPGWSAHYANLASLYRQVGRRDEAVMAMQQAIAMAPAIPTYYLNLGLWYEEDEDIEMAISLYRQLYQMPHTWHDSPFWQTEIAAQAVDGIAPGRTILYLRAEEIYARGNENGAERIFQRIAGYDRLTNGDFNDARAIFQELSAQNTDANAYLGMGIAYLYLEDVEGAEEAFEQAEIFASGSISDIVVLWQITMSTSAENMLPSAVTELQNYYSVSGTDKYSHYYVLPVFERETIPHDFLPQLSCFTFPPTVGLHIQLLQEWYASQGDEVNADYLQAVILGENNGVASCVPSASMVSQDGQ